MRPIPSVQVFVDVFLFKRDFAVKKDLSNNKQLFPLAEWPNSVALEKRKLFKTPLSALKALAAKINKAFLGPELLNPQE